MKKINNPLVGVLLLLFCVISGCSKDDFRSQYVGRYEGSIKLALVVKGIEHISERGYYVNLDPSDDKALIVSELIPISRVKLRWIKNGEWDVSIQPHHTICPHDTELIGDVRLSEDSIQLNLLLFDLNQDIVNKDSLIVISSARKVKL